MLYEVITPVLNDGYYDEAVELIGKHKPAGALSGGKYSLLEAGTRVPFCVYWKGQIMPSVSPALISQVDLFNSLAAMVGSNIKAKDSEQLLDVLLGKSVKGRDQLIIEANGRTARITSYNVCYTKLLREIPVNILTST